MTKLPALACVPALLLALTNVLNPPAIGACSLVGNDDHHLDPSYATDTTPPGAVTASVTDLFHHDDDGGGGGCGRNVSSCGSYGLIVLDVSATDDVAPSDRIGYQLRVTGGVPPRGLNVPTLNVQPYPSELYLYFSHDDHDWSFDLEVRAVDLNGNLGPATVVSISE